MKLMGCPKYYLTLIHKLDSRWNSFDGFVTDDLEAVHFQTIAQKI